jgi:hypothetical protein
MSLDKSFKSKGKSQVGYSKYKQAQLKSFTDALNKVSAGINYKSIFTTANQLYEKGFSGLDLIEYVKENLKTETDYTILLALHKMKPEVRNENLFIAFGLQCLFLRSDKALENMGSL